ncbi:MAG: hypothetical protein WBW81_03560 [Methylocella sp.]
MRSHNFRRIAEIEKIKIEIRVAVSRAPCPEVLQLIDLRKDAHYPHSPIDLECGHDLSIASPGTLRQD